MTRWLLAGDTHGDHTAIDVIFQMASDKDADRIVQLGDFGYGFGPMDGYGRDPWLRYVQQVCEETTREFYWLDGNHDNHPKLWSNYDSGKLQEHAPLVHYMPRGSTWNFDGISVGVIGGAVSIDRNYRKIGMSYWATETIRGDEALRAEANFVSAKVQVILSHDAPTSATGALKHGAEHDYWERILPADIKYDVKENREKLENLLRAVRPKHWFHGHYHYAYEQWILKTHMMGLDMTSHGAGRDGCVVVEVSPEGSVEIVE